MIKYIPSADVIFSTFPSSLVARYDVYYESGRETSVSGTKVTSENAHIYKLLDKSGNGHDLISRSTASIPSNKFVSSGLGLSKPCVAINSSSTGSNPTITGYATTTFPAFPDGFELICVVRPTASSSITQNLVAKFNPSSSFAHPFVVKFDRVVGRGTSTTATWSNVTNLDTRATFTTAFIMGTRFFIANSTSNSNTVPNGTAQERLNGSDNGSYAVTNSTYYQDSTTNNPLGLCYRANNSTQQVSFEIGEVMLFNAPLAPTDRELMEGYLASKWGIPLTNTSHSCYNKVVAYSGSNP
jgi:hypothetical protein